jgi:hypothetical protein
LPLLTGNKCTAGRLPVSVRSIGAVIHASI